MARRAPSSWPLRTRTASVPQTRKGGGGPRGKRPEWGARAHLVAVPAPLPSTYLLSCWELAPLSLPLNPKSGCPQTHSLLRAWVPERPPSLGPVLSQWEGTHFWEHTDQVQVPASPPTGPGTSLLWVSAPCSRASLCSQLPRRLWGLTVEAIPGTEGTETLLGELTLFILTSSHDDDSQPSGEQPLYPEKVTRAPGGWVAYPYFLELTICPAQPSPARGTEWEEPKTQSPPHWALTLAAP